MADAAGADDLAGRLDALRAAGADPVRLAYLDALARRAGGQPEAIRRPLFARMNALAGELAARAIPAARPEAAAAAPGPLADLLAHIGRHAHALPEATLPTVDRNFPPKSKKPPVGHRDPAPELKAVAYFRDAWSRLSTEQQLTRTLAQAPENAGPMNSQHLVLRSLQVMRDVAPDYLQGFMSHIDTLIWLEQADPARAASRSSAGDSEKKPRVAKRGAAKR